MNETQIEEFQISEPFIHKNLAIFLIHGEDKIKDRTFLTLQEAMEQKKLIVHETDNVNELAIENVTADEEVYIQSGDIVRGGKQDRVFAFDFVVPAQSGRTPIASFCVEQGRWHRRGQEAADHFTSSNDRATTRELNIAIKHSTSQSEVWESVSDIQESLTGSLGRSVHSSQSSSSLLLSLEDDKVKETSEDYLKDLSSIIEEKEDVIGYVFTINGKINSGDTYVSSSLFKKLWPKLLKASAIEAIIHQQKDEEIRLPSADAVRTFLIEAENGTVSEKEVSGRIRMVTHEKGDSIRFETRDLEKDNVWIHRNYVAK